MQKVILFSIFTLFYFVSLGQTGSMEQRIQKLLEELALARQNKNANSIKDLTAQLAALYEAKGKNQQAYSLLKESIFYSDSLFKVRQRNTISDLEKQLAFEEKDKLLAQAQQAKSAQALQFQYFQSLTLVLVILIVASGIGLLLKKRLQKVQLEKKTIDLQQRLLRAQMNPHFAFNALTSIQHYLFQSGQSEKAISHLNKFSELMRQILVQNNQAKISLAEEILTLENYISLQQLRYENKFTYETQIAPELELNQTYLPPMLIQPLIENAIEHGKVHTVKDGNICLKIGREERSLKISVWDNGIGAKAASLKRSKEKTTAVGTKIIKERLHILKKYYGQKVGYHISHPIHGGTEVLLTLPYTTK